MSVRIHQVNSADSTAAADITVAAHLVALAFRDLPINTWLVPDPDERLPVTTNYFRLWAEHAAHGYGTVLLAGDDNGPIGAAVWLDYTLLPEQPVAEPDHYRERLAEATGRHAERFRLLDEQMDQAHPHHDPHWYLLYLAVHPHHQGEGVGSALLEHSLPPLHAAGHHAYLEATGTRNAALYQRHGFTAMDPPRFPVGDPGANIAFRPMWAPGSHDAVAHPAGRVSS